MLITLWPYINKPTRTKMRSLLLLSFLFVFLSTEALVSTTHLHAHSKNEILFRIHSQNYGPNNFGDIITDRGVSVKIIGDFIPMERIVLSANGNLQRILSAYHGSPIRVDVLKCLQLQERVFHREVNLMLNDRKLCAARGEIQVDCDECLEAIHSKRVGVGQLFRFLGVLPSFKLLAVGKLSSEKENGAYSLWREYELSCKQLKCRFVEQFETDFLQID